MQPAPHPNDDETGTEEDALVADPLADQTLELFDGTAKKNRAVFTEIFRTVPSNLVRDYKAYEVCFSPLLSFLFFFVNFVIYVCSLGVIVSDILYFLSFFLCLFFSLDVDSNCG